jgi:hypothetical protein
MVMTVPERFARRHNLHYSRLPIDDVPRSRPTCSGMKAPTGSANRWMREQIIELSQQQTENE